MFLGDGFKVHLQRLSYVWTWMESVHCSKRDGQLLRIQASIVYPNRRFENTHPISRFS
jgi:hypothetical protein